MSRRALILLDGVDEGGAFRERLERHIVNVLVPQGLTMVITSRPAGLSEALFTSFYRVSISTLTHSEQEVAVGRRLHRAFRFRSGRPEVLLDYLHSKVTQANHNHSHNHNHNHNSILGIRAGFRLRSRLELELGLGLAHSMHNT